MNAVEISNLLPANFSDSARVWIYQGSRPFIEKEQNEIDEQLHHFYSQWKSHGDEVKSWAKLLFSQFIVVMADLSDDPIGGCSTDGMQRMIKSLERQYEVSFFDRMTLTFLIEGKAQMLPFEQVQYAVDKGYINADTVLFNNIATTKKELIDTWLVPLKNSWLSTRVSYEKAAVK
ncbi:MAG: hypothetical protein JSS78_04425 [Bacteroidetes bacterium]|nr:hypothetical protein [Bacteroidota bacterium]